MMRREGDHLIVYRPECSCGWKYRGGKGNASTLLNEELAQQQLVLHFHANHAGVEQPSYVVPVPFDLSNGDERPIEVG